MPSNLIGAREHGQLPGVDGCDNVTKGPQWTYRRAPAIMRRTRGRPAVVLGRSALQSITKRTECRPRLFSGAAFSCGTPSRASTTTHLIVGDIEARCAGRPDPECMTRGPLA